MTHRVFIDGQAGTTGLELASRLDSHAQIELLAIEDGLRRDASRRRELFAETDAVVLCLPDQAAREAVEFAPDARFLDASTAHRTSAGWVYGLPELEPGQRQAIRSADRVANPGCYPTGFVLSVRPLIDDGLVSPDLPLRANVVSGFSGGGRSMIAKYRDCDSAAWRHRAYALHLNHKHLPEMRRYAKTERAPCSRPRSATTEWPADAGGAFRGRVAARRGTRRRAPNPCRALRRRTVRPCPTPTTPRTARTTACCRRPHATDRIAST